MRTFVLDDQASSREAITSALRGAGLEVAGAANAGDDGIDQAERAGAAVVVMSIHDAGEVASVDRMRNVVPQLPVLVVAPPTDDVVARLRRSRASGFVSTHASPDDVARAVRNLSAGATDPSEALTPGGEHRPPAGLTAREDQMIRLLSEGMTAPAIAKRLFLSRRTVEFHLARAYRKLGVRSRIDAIMAYARLTHQTVR